MEHAWHVVIARRSKRYITFYKGHTSNLGTLKCKPKTKRRTLSVRARQQANKDVEHYLCRQNC
eukprot:1404106-Amphidinium_carterae.1